MNKIPTREKILREGRALLQKHGYNGFSFQDIANRIDIKKPSLYDHFASKEDLIISIIQTYNHQFDDWTQKNSPLSPIMRIRKIFDLFHSFSCDKRKICPILALSTDQKGLSKKIQKEITLFVDKWLSWLELQINAGKQQGQIRKNIDTSHLAEFIYSQAMGAQLQSRIQDKPELTLQSGDLIISLIRCELKGHDSAIF